MGTQQKHPVILTGKERAGAHSGLVFIWSGVIPEGEAVWRSLYEVKLPGR